MRIVIKRLLLTVAAILFAMTGVPGHLAARESEGYTIGLSMYSLRQLFHSGELDALDYPALAKKTFGITKVDVWYGGLPRNEVNNPAFYTKLKECAAAEGVEIFLLMTGTLDVQSSDPAELKKQAQKFFVDVDRADLLGARFLRIFLNASGDKVAALRRTVTGLRVLTDYAQSKNIILVIEPGGSALTRDGVFLADVAKAINRPACRLMPDFGKMLGADPYKGTEAMMPYTAVVSAKTHDIYENGETQHFDYPRLMKRVADAGFTGIVAIEYEGKNLGPVEGVKATQRILEELNR